MVANTCNIYSDPEYHDTPAYKDGYTPVYIEGFSSGYTTVLEYILEDII